MGCVRSSRMKWAVQSQLPLMPSSRIDSPPDHSLAVVTTKEMSIKGIGLGQARSISDPHYDKCDRPSAPAEEL